MSSTRSVYTGHGVIDLEAGPVDNAAIKSAGLMAEKFYDATEQTRNRAARDRDRASPGTPRRSTMTANAGSYPPAASSARAVLAATQKPVVGQTAGP